METEKTIPATYEERMRIATISEKTRDYLMIYGRLEDIWGDVDRLLARDYHELDKKPDEFGELMADVVGKVQDYIQDSILNNLGWNDCIAI